MSYEDAVVPIYGYNNETGCEYRLNPVNQTQSPVANLCMNVFNLHNYYLILIVIIGLVGNSLTILIFFRSKFSYYNRTKFYLICLSISDNVYLVTLFFVWLDHMGLLLIINNNYVCQISNYVTYISSFMSTQLVVAFTSQRLFSICFPLKNNIIEKKSKFIIIGLVLFACAFYNYALWGYNSECPERDHLIFETSIPRCKARKKYENLVDELDLADSLFTFIFPFIAILIMNLIIIRRLRNSNYDFIVCTANSLANNQNNNNNCIINNQNFNNNRDNRNRMKLNGKQLRVHLKHELPKDAATATQSKPLMVNRQRSPSSSVYIFRDPREQQQYIDRKLSDYSASKKSSATDSNIIRASVYNKPACDNGIQSGTSVSHKVTKMLICVSTVFLLLNLPYHSFKLYVYIRIRKTDNPKYTNAESCIIHFLQQIFYASFSLNFFLYSISGVAFRNELKDFLPAFLKKR